jgi:tetratricopeptide (TPR) repeat protein
MSDGISKESVREAIASAESSVQRERWQDALEAYRRAAELADSDDGHGPARADALRGAAIVRMRLGEWQEAVRDAAESRLIAQRDGDERRLSLAENARGAIEFERGNWEEAARRYAVARMHAAAVEDVPLLMEIENNEGILWAARGDRVRAEQYFRRALHRFEVLERHPCGARVLNNLGMVLASDGRYEEAEEAYARALTECKRRGDLVLATMVMINRGRLALMKDEPIRAHSLATTAQAFAERLANGPLAADAACLLGAVSRSQRRWAEAGWQLAVALAMSAGGRAPLAEAEVWLERGQLYEDMGQIDDSIESLRQARRCYLGLGSDAEAERLEARISELVAAGRPFTSIARA